MKKEMRIKWNLSGPYRVKGKKEDIINGLKKNLNGFEFINDFMNSSTGYEIRFYVNNPVMENIRNLLYNLKCERHHLEIEV